MKESPTLLRFEETKYTGGFGNNIRILAFSSVSQLKVLFSVVTVHAFKSSSASSHDLLKIDTAQSSAKLNKLARPPVFPDVNFMSTMLCLNLAENIQLLLKFDVQYLMFTLNKPLSAAAPLRSIDFKGKLSFSQQCCKPYEKVWEITDIIIQLGRFA